MGVERWDPDASSSRSSSESSSDVLLMASSLGGGGALAAVFLWSRVSSLLLLLVATLGGGERHKQKLCRTFTRHPSTSAFKPTHPNTDFPVSSGLRTVNGLGSTPTVLGMNSLHGKKSGEPSTVTAMAITVEKPSSHIINGCKDRRLERSNCSFLSFTSQSWSW